MEEKVEGKRQVTIKSYAKFIEAYEVNIAKKEGVATCASKTIEIGDCW